MEDFFFFKLALYDDGIKTQLHVPIFSWNAFAYFDSICLDNVQFQGVNHLLKSVFLVLNLSSLAAEWLGHLSHSSEVGSLSPGCQRSHTW